MCDSNVKNKHDHVFTDSTILSQPHGAGDETRSKKKGLEAVNEDLRVANEELEAMNEEMVAAQKELVEANVLLAESESRFRTIDENANEIIYVLNDAGIFLFLSPAWTKYLGHPVDEVVGRSFELFVYEDDIMLCRDFLATILSTGKSARGIEYRVLHKNGAWIWHTSSGSMMRDKGGRSLYVGVAQSIGERKIHEEELRRSEEKFRAFAESTATALIIIQGTRYVYVNPAFTHITGYTPEDLKDISSWAIVHPDFADIVRQRGFARQRSKYAPSRYEIKIITKSGKVRWIDFSATFIHYAGNNAMLASASDITERTQSENFLIIQRDLAVGLSSTSNLHDALNQALDAALRVDGIDCGGVYLIDDAEMRIQPVCHRGFSEAHVSLMRELQNSVLRERVLARNEAIYSFDELSTEDVEHLRNDAGIRGVAIIPVMNEGAIAASLNLASHSMENIPLCIRSVLEAIAAQVGGVIARVRAEESLHENEARLRMILDASNYGYWDWDFQKGELLYSVRIEQQKYMIKKSITRISCDYSELHASKNFGAMHPVDRAMVIQSLVEHLNGATGMYQVEYRAITREKIYRWFLVRGRVIERSPDGKSLRMMGIYTDITDRKTIEEQVRNSLNEKEVLLKEIHHRVKNNMQIISSLLNLQAAKIKNPETLTVFTESQNRVKSMALVHEKLYRSKDLAGINCREYIESLATSLFRSYCIGTVNLIVDVENVQLDINTAIPCGLIINELVTNSLKYAFPGGRSGVIGVRMNNRPDSGMCILEVEDDGIGFPADVDYTQMESLGMLLVNSLTTQLNGGIELDTSHGTLFRISFPRT